MKKNRFSGDIGEVFLGFDKETKRFIESNYSFIYLFISDLGLIEIVGK